MRVTKRTKGREVQKPDAPKKKWYPHHGRNVWQVTNFDKELQDRFCKHAVSKGVHIYKELEEVVTAYLDKKGLKAPARKAKRK